MGIAAKHGVEFLYRILKSISHFDKLLCFLILFQLPLILGAQDTTSNSRLVKLRRCEKATKKSTCFDIDINSYHYCSSGSLFQIFVAFSENINFMVGTYVKNL